MLVRKLQVQLFRKVVSVANEKISRKAFLKIYFDLLINTDYNEVNMT